MPIFLASSVCSCNDSMMPLPKGVFPDTISFLPRLTIFLPVELISPISIFRFLANFSMPIFFSAAPGTPCLTSAATFL